MTKELVFVRDDFYTAYLLDGEAGTVQALTDEAADKLSLRRSCIQWSEHVDNVLRDDDDPVIYRIDVHPEFSLFRLYNFIGEKEPKEGFQDDPLKWSPAWVKLACAIIKHEWDSWLAKQRVKHVRKDHTRVIGAKKQTVNGKVVKTGGKVISVSASEPEGKGEKAFLDIRMDSVEEYVTANGLVKPPAPAKKRKKAIA